MYSLRSELLVAEMDVSRCILVLDTSISATSNLERREYYREQPIIVPLHTSVCLIDSSIIRKLCMVVWCLMVVVEC